MPALRRYLVRDGECGVKLLYKLGPVAGNVTWLRCDQCGRRIPVRDTEELSAGDAFEVALLATTYHNANYGCRRVLVWDDGVSSSDRVPAVADRERRVEEGGAMLPRGEASYVGAPGCVLALIVLFALAVAASVAAQTVAGW